MPIRSTMQSREASAFHPQQQGLKPARIAEMIPLPIRFSVPSTTTRIETYRRLCPCIKWIWLQRSIHNNKD